MQSERWPPTGEQLVFQWQYLRHITTSCCSAVGRTTKAQQEVTGKENRSDRELNVDTLQVRTMTKQRTELHPHARTHGLALLIEVKTWIQTYVEFSSSQRIRGPTKVPPKRQTLILFDSIDISADWHFKILSSIVCFTIHVLCPT